jgi:hypothetical protein
MARLALPSDPGKSEDLRNRYRVLIPSEPLPDAIGQTTRNSFGRRAVRVDYIVEGRDGLPDGQWEFITAAPDLSTVLGLGGRGYNRDLKEFIRIELLRLFPGRYRSRADLPTEEDAYSRRGPDAREGERRVLRAQLAALTPEFTCANCDYYGPMIPRAEGPFSASHLSEDTLEQLGAAPGDMLPAAFCPRCRVMLSFRVGTDLDPPVGAGDADEYRCNCGFRGRPAFDMLTEEYTCPQCGLVVGETIYDGPPGKRSDE